MSLRYKADVETYDGGLDVVGRLRPISFKWKQGGTPDIGLAAEEVEAVEPRFAFRGERGEIEGVKYGQLAAVFVNAFKEQQVQIASQQRQIAAQQRELDELKQIVRSMNPGRASLLPS